MNMGGCPSCGYVYNISDAEAELTHLRAVLAAARAEVARLREANMELRVQLRGEADARVGDLQQLSAEQASLEHALTALREAHAAAVQKAYREGFGKGWGQGWDHGDLARPCDAAWLASEAKARIDAI